MRGVFGPEDTVLRAFVVRLDSTAGLAASSSLATDQLGGGFHRYSVDEFWHGESRVQQQQQVRCA